MRLRYLGLVVAIAACGSEDEAPDNRHEFVYELKDHDKTYTDVPFEFDTATQFRTADVLEDLDVAAIEVVGDVVYAATGGGVYRIADSRDAFVGVTTEPAVDLDTDGTIVVAVGPAGVQRFEAGALSETWTASASATSVTIGTGGVYVGATGVYEVRADGQTVVAGSETLVVTDLLAVGDVLFVAHDAGLARFGPARTDIDVGGVPRALGRAGADVLVALEDALLRLDAAGAEVARYEAGMGAFPTASFTAAVEADGVLFAGHEIGASTIEGTKIDHYSSRRWLPDQRVNDVAFGPGRDRWIATPGGITRVWFDTTTLAERAARDEALLDDHWRMDGFVDDNMPLNDPDDPSSYRNTDHDNDGLWTEMQIGTWCYAYAVTGDEQYYEKARRALDVMFLQIDIPGVTFEAAGMKKGFITRSLVRDDEGEIFDNKEPQDNWHLQSYEGRNYYWKDDTSSDEYAGHYFGIPVFYDLCAKDEAERQAIRDRIRLTTDYIVDNDYLLIDLDGEPTLHGHWDRLGIAADGLDRCTEKYGVDSIAKCVESRHGGGWLNSTEILGHLLAAWHITGDAKYYDEYERLFTEEKYGKMVKVIEDTFTVTQPAFANHSDHELAMLAFITLIRYDPNEDRRKTYEQSLLDFYEYEREEHNPWQIAVIGSVHSGDVDLDGAIQTMKDLPTDWRTWTVDNDHRVDADRWPDDRHDQPQFSRVFPYDEIRTMKWNGSPYRVSQGQGGRSRLAPTPYLIAYWMLRFHQMID